MPLFRQYSEALRSILAWTVFVVGYGPSVGGSISGNRQGIGGTTCLGRCGVGGGVWGGAGAGRSHTYMSPTASEMIQSVRDLWN